MELSLVLQTLVNLVVLGAIYALLAAGLSLIFSILHIVNFAHGQMFMLGSFAVFFLFGEWGINYFASLLIAMGMLGVFAALLERGLFRQVRGQDLPSMIIGLGLLLLLEGVALLAFGNKAHYVPAVMAGVFQFAGVFLPKVKLLLIGVSLVLALLLFLFLKLMKPGRAMRAVAQDVDAAALQGIDVNRINTYGFALGSALAAGAGGLMLPITFITPGVGQHMVITAFIIVILGGLGSIRGAVAGAFAFAAIETFGFTFVGEFAPLITFALVILVLLFRPAGLLGEQ